MPEELDNDQISEKLGIAAGPVIFEVILTSSEKALRGETDRRGQIYVEKPFPSRWLHEFVQADPIRPSDRAAPSVREEASINSGRGQIPYRAANTEPATHSKPAGARDWPGPFSDKMNLASPNASMTTRLSSLYAVSLKPSGNESSTSFPSGSSGSTFPEPEGGRAVVVGKAAGKTWRTICST